LAQRNQTPIHSLLQEKTLEPTFSHSISSGNYVTPHANSEERAFITLLRALLLCNPTLRSPQRICLHRKTRRASSPCGQPRQQGEEHQARPAGCRLPLHRRAPHHLQPRRETQSRAQPPPLSNFTQERCHFTGSGAERSGGSCSTSRYGQLSASPSSPAILLCAKRQRMIRSGM